MKTISIQDMNCIIGSNAKENWELLDSSKPTNILFHLSSFPSCYVILENDSEKYPTEEIIREASILCRNNTKYKNMRDIKVDYTFCNNVMKGENVGQIYYKSNRKVLTIKI
jgi:predicted ribosome quality control (RQC) complex YloA/Tae2 family protein